MVDLVEKYAAKGIKVDLSWDNKFVDGVHLPFDAATWIDLLDTEGEALGSCCANISSIRDRLFTAVRHSRIIDAYDLHEVYILIRDHNCGEDYTEADITKASKDPLVKLMWLWEQIKEDVKPDSLLHKNKKRDKERTIFDDFDSIINASRVLCWSDILKHNDTDDFHKFNSKVNIAVALGRILPALQHINAKLEEIAPAPFKGYAVCYKNTEEIADTRLGLAVYKTKKLAQELGQPLDDFEIRKVEISLENGVKFLD